MPKLADSIKALERLVEKVAENASGESSASQEAINRVAAEKAAGQTRLRIDPNGNATPLQGVDAVDTAAPAGHVHVMLDAQGNPTVTDRGGLPLGQAYGLLQRYLGAQDLAMPLGYAEGGQVSSLEQFTDGITAAMHRSTLPFGTGYESAYNTGRNAIDNPTADATRRVQGTEGRSDFAALAQKYLPKSPLQPVTAGGLPMPGFAEGGSTDSTPEEQAEFNTTSTLRKLANAARSFGGPEHPEARARLASNIASLLYGLDAKGNPVLGGRAWTSTQGGTPMGALDAVTAIPHGVVGLAQLADKYLPGKSNPAFWESIDPGWSKDAAARLAKLHTKVQQTSGVGEPTDTSSAILDAVSDPGTAATLGVAKIAPEASALKRLIEASLWGGGDNSAVATTGR